MRYVSAGLVTGGRTGHRFKDQLTAKIASKLWGLTYAHNPFPKDLHDEHLWEPFLGFGDNETQLSDLNLDTLKLVRIDTTAWCGLDLEETQKIIEQHTEDNVLFFFTESARIVLEQLTPQLRQEIIEELRTKYWRRRKMNAVDSYFSSTVINIAIHIRRGEDVSANAAASWRRTSDEYYLTIIQNLRQVLPFKVEFHIYSEGEPKEFLAYRNQPDIYIHLCPWPPNYSKLFISFHHMITADILITATSEFSYMVAHLNPNLTITLPVQSVCKLPDEPRHLKSREDGSFDTEKLLNYVEQISVGKNWEKKTASLGPLTIRCDDKENLEVVNNVKRWVSNHNLIPVIAKPEEQITYSTLYLRTPYHRFYLPNDVCKLFKKHNFARIVTKDKDIVALNPALLANKISIGFTLDNEAEVVEPEIEPLPILLVTHRRPALLKQSLMSLLYSIQSSRQKIYILASAPDEETIKTLKYLIATDHRITEVAISQDNLGYAVGNCGIKTFDLPEFIHFEDDFILPEHTRHLFPFWTQQFRLRLADADLVSFRVSTDNMPIETLNLYDISEKFKKFTLGQWNYYSVEPKDSPPISGNGLYINSNKLYSKIEPPYYYQSDMAWYQQCKTICLANVCVYHTGANFHINQDRTSHARTEPIRPPQKVEVRFLKSGKTKVIDLAQAIRF